MRTSPTPRLGGQTKITGPGASSLKYDILTALLVTAARGDPESARLALRLSLLVTARYNWQQDSFAIGQREIARMWGVTERTAKREMAAMRAREWLVVKVPAARGRVTQYGIRFDAVLRDTTNHWEAVGPDFAARMSGPPAAAPEPSGNVVPLKRATHSLPDPDGTAWPDAMTKLMAQDPAVASAWFSRLVAVEVENGVLTLMAPSRFVADYIRTHFTTHILAAVLSVDPTLRDVAILSQAEG
ncbi:hypothetical protein GQA70_19745 (plasmid) [Ponticoccus alexandrii]|uniref:DnaA N-terminal domain-containing protein n=2 Tax=Ponticoccus alexandrii TaxID=1943633 RepID=A0ABX7FDV9_9RHOB|nr:hypothetical protein GQA70_19745 [Ponticoccus alexandrii]